MEEKVKPDYTIFKSEIARLETFKPNLTPLHRDEWPHDFVSGEECAKAGLFYLGIQDYVHCPYCNVTIGDWSPDGLDTALDIHQTLRPNCVFADAVQIEKKKDEESPLVKLLKGAVSQIPATVLDRIESNIEDTLNPAASSSFPPPEIGYKETMQCNKIMLETVLKMLENLGVSEVQVTDSEPGPSKNNKSKVDQINRKAIQHEARWICHFPNCCNAFETKDRLKSHIRNLHKDTNTDRKSFKCAMCPRVFGKSNGFTRHLATHGQVKKVHRCEKCGTGFTRYDNLQKHVKNKKCKGDLYSGPIPSPANSHISELGDLEKATLFDFDEEFLTF